MCSINIVICYLYTIGGSHFYVTTIQYVRYNLKSEEMLVYPSLFRISVVTKPRFRFRVDKGGGLGWGGGAQTVII